MQEFISVCDIPVRISQIFLWEGKTIVCKVQLSGRNKSCKLLWVMGRWEPWSCWLRITSNKHSSVFWQQLKQLSQLSRGLAGPAIELWMSMPIVSSSQSVAHVVMHRSNLTKHSLAHRMKLQCVGIQAGLVFCTMKLLFWHTFCWNLTWIPIEIVFQCLDVLLNHCTPSEVSPQVYITQPFLHDVNVEGWFSKLSCYDKNSKGISGVSPNSRLGPQYFLWRTTWSRFVHDVPGQGGHLVWIPCNYYIISTVWGVNK